MKKITLFITLLCSHGLLASQAHINPPNIYDDDVIIPAPGTHIDATNVIINKPSFYKPIFTLGHGLGFAWAGREGFDKFLGAGMEVINIGNNTYRLQPNNTPYGYPEDVKLPNRNPKMTVEVENINYYMTGKDLIMGDPKVQEETLESAFIATVLNCSPTQEDTTTTVATHEETESWSRSETQGSSMEAGIKTGFSVTVKIPLTGQVQGSTEFNTSFSDQQSWTESKSGTETNSFQVRHEMKIKPLHKRTVNLYFMKARAKIPYTTKLIMDYDLKFNGFLRFKDDYINDIPDYYEPHKSPQHNDWNGNAYKEDTSRYETISYTFGTGATSAKDDILSQYMNDLSGYSESSPWDWDTYITSMVNSLGMTCSKWNGSYFEEVPCEDTMQAWEQWGNQPLAEVLRRYAVQESGEFDVETVGLFHVVSGQDIPLTENEIVTSCAGRTDTLTIYE
ncbi:TPA: aerolysin family beta-barrel pore-forming toxin [Vibrio cholerae]|nr:aerolysin family beta-barrel pore-forming toxin [Vibrio cholerae]